MKKKKHLLQILLWGFVLFSASISGKLEAEPPRGIPQHLWAQFTLNGAIPVTSMYFNDTYSEPKFYSKETIDVLMQKAYRKETFYYGDTDTFVYQALDDLADSIVGKEVAVIGSVIPWYESILLTYHARPVVIEYNPIQTNDVRVTYLTLAQYAANPKKFDLILSISSTEHDGLGRYGDPIDPNGDLKSMDAFKKMLNPGGKLLLVVPVGKDELVWNAHRIYGQLRLKLLLKGWRPLHYYGFDATHVHYTHNTHYQPAFLLEPK